MSQAIKPTVGRVLWYYPRGQTGPCLAAMVARVWTDECINIGYLKEDGTHANETSVRLVQGEDESPTLSHCRWMPFQMGQAAKTAEAEARSSKTA